MSTDDRKDPNTSPASEKKDETVTDLPAREASSGKDEDIKGGRMKLDPLSSADATIIRR